MSPYPHLASNPIRSFAPVLSRLNDIRWDEGNAHFPPTSFEVVEIEAGVGAPNVIPGSLRARFNFRYSTQWSKETLKEEVHAVFGDFEIDFELTWRLSGDPSYRTRQADVRHGAGHRGSFRHRDGVLDRRRYLRRPLHIAGRRGRRRARPG